MKPIVTNGRSRGLTLIEVIVVIAVVVVLVGVILPAFLQSGHHDGPYCSNNLKQIGLSFRIFANDNDNKLPWEISTNDGGSREYRYAPNSAFRHFQVMSNELSTPKILVCPEDRKRVWSTNWVTGFDNQNVSYFVGLNASETNANSILSGDRYLTGNRQPTNGFLELTSRDTIGWTKRYHDYHGYVVFGDGSAQRLERLDSAGLQRAVRESGVATNRLAIP
ncbi:MAG TPA: prepilin-type N-terminal cleavage/methylation domain-containing protein [Candidatus Angelobacter sp.]|nr:prepilin-type N-terminal cleavage/methylation domain-containing protein [Candidatus Angelobacter sp.]